MSQKTTTATKFIQRTAAELFGVDFGKQLPVHTADHSFVPPEDKAYSFRPSLMVKLLTFLISHEIPTGSKYFRKALWISGDTGSGKSSLVEQTCNRLNMPVFMCQGSNEVIDLDLYGTMVPCSGEQMIKLADGAVTQSIRLSHERPVVCMFDEGDMFRPSTLSALNPLLEGRSISIAQTGEKIAPNLDNWRLVLCANTVGEGGSGTYVATNRHNAATLRRFLHLIVPYPSEEVETRIYKAKFPNISEDILKGFIHIGQKARDSHAKEDGLPCPIGMREIQEALLGYQIYGQQADKITEWLHKNRPGNQWKDKIISAQLLAVANHLLGPPFTVEENQAIMTWASDKFKVMKNPVGTPVTVAGWDYPLHDDIMAAMDDIYAAPIPRAIAKAA